MILKNQSVVITYYAINTGNNQARTGDVANHTIRLIKDGGTPVAPTNSPSEVDATNCPGVYKLTLTAAETNFDTITLSGKSSTGNTRIDLVRLFTFTKTGYSLATGSILAATFAAGAIDSNALAAGAITSTKFAAGAIDATAIANGAITSTKFATDAIDANALKADAVTEIVTGVFAKTIDGKTFAEISEFIMAYTTGKIVKTGNVYDYKKQDGTTTLFQLTSASTSRTRTA